jgi:hypothetical protein
MEVGFIQILTGKTQEAPTLIIQQKTIMIVPASAQEKRALLEEEDGFVNAKET